MGVHTKEREQAELKQNYVKKSTTILLVIMALLMGAFIGNTITMLYVGQNQQRGGVTQSAPQAAPDEHTADPQALAGLEQAAAADPTNAEAWVRLGNFCFDHNLPEKAITAYERALELAPRNVDVWSDLGVMYRRTKQFEKAVDAFGHAASLDPQHITSRFNMGVVYLHDLNDPASALKVWKEVLALDPNATTPTGQSLEAMVKSME